MLDELVLNAVIFLGEWLGTGRDKNKKTIGHTKNEVRRPVICLDVDVLYRAVSIT